MSIGHTRPCHRRIMLLPGRVSMFNHEYLNYTGEELISFLRLSSGQASTTNIKYRMGKELDTKD